MDMEILLYTYFRCLYDIPKHMRFGQEDSMNSLDFDDFRIEPVSGGIQRPHTLAVAAADPLGNLGGLRGTFKGVGFNQIWRPFNGLPAMDRFLELNETSEVLQFVEIQGDIP